MPTTPGRNTYRWRQVTAQVKAEEDTCHLCRRLIDKALPQTSPWSFTVDHTIAIEHLTLDDPRREDRAYLRAAHRRCNSSRGSRPISATPSREW